MKKKILPERVRKRDNSLVRFKSSKIKDAVWKAGFEVLQDKRRTDTLSVFITEKVLKRLTSLYKDTVPAVENIQDVVEVVLMEEGYSHIARAYIVYREKHTDIRQTKLIYGVKDDLKLPVNTLEVLRKRYLLKDENQNIIETPSELFRRVACHIASAERNFKKRASVAEIEEKFYHMMRNREFLPNSPTLMNAGTSLGQLSGCFVLPVEDSIDGIFESLKGMAVIHQTGGGTGFSFSRLRPKGDLVSSTNAQASGPVSFMTVFDRATSVIVQGGRRRGANIGILRCDHPDIVEFVEAKTKEDALSNFNLSIGITEKFMEALRRNRDFELINPRTKRVAGKIRARALFDLIVNAAWRTGDPGVVFLDRINAAHPLRKVGRIESTNPCGELPLLPYESCNLGSINLSRFVRNGKIDFEELKDIIHLGVRFLDNVIEVNRFPLPRVREITLRNRKIGLGVMGFADMLIKLNASYASNEALEIAAKVMKFMRRQSLNASLGLAKERGVFPNFRKSIYAEKNIRLRNSTLNTVAPTGSISIIAGCSSGTEPIFAISFVRNVLLGSQLFEVNQAFEEEMKRRGRFSKELIARIAQEGSVQNIKEIPVEARKIFVTAFDISPAQHIKMQSAFQRFTDNSVSKTINLPFDSTVDDVRKIYLLAYELKCKGITVYRYGSKKEQVLSFGSVEIARHRDRLVTAQPEYSGGCAYGRCLF